jgi:hypothetical protein
MPATFKDISECLAQLGVSEKSLRLIHFGGVVGKLALISVCCVLGTAVVALKSESTAILWGCLITIGVLGLASLVVIGLHAHRHPLEATLEGGQIVALKHLEHAIAIKGNLDVVQTLPIPPPKELIGNTETKNGGTS